MNRLKSVYSGRPRIWNESERGHAVIEFAIVSFLLFLIPLSTFECATLLRAKQISTVLSRELASLVYRECIADDEAFPINRTDAPVSRFDPRLCVTGVVETQFRAEVNNLFANCGTNPQACPRLAVSLFSSNASGSSAERDFVLNDDILDSEFAHFDRNIVLADAQSHSSGDLGNALKNYRVLVVAQVRVPIREPAAGRGWLLSFFIDRIYGTTIV